MTKKALDRSLTPEPLLKSREALAGDWGAEWQKAAQAEEQYLPDNVQNPSLAWTLRGPDGVLQRWSVADLSELRQEIIAAETGKGRPSYRQPIDNTDANSNKLASLITLPLPVPPGSHVVRVWMRPLPDEAADTADAWSMQHMPITAKGEPLGGGYAYGLFHWSHADRETMLQEYSALKDCGKPWNKSRRASILRSMRQDREGIWLVPVRFLPVAGIDQHDQMVGQWQHPAVTKIEGGHPLPWRQPRTE